MNCPHCKSEEVCRAPRRTTWDNLKSSMGRWPYTCDACGRHFTAAQRYGSRPKQKTRTSPDPPRDYTTPTGPEMAYRNDPVRPLAKVVIEADDQVQLDQILLALHRAISYYKQPVRERTEAER